MMPRNDDINFFGGVATTNFLNTGGDAKNRVRMSELRRPHQQLRDFDFTNVFYEIDFCKIITNFLVCETHIRYFA